LYLANYIAYRQNWAKVMDWWLFCCSSLICNFVRSLSLEFLEYPNPSYDIY
jgi:hypothetical protein